MIGFGTAVTQPNAYQRWAQPGIERAQERDSVVYPNSSFGSIFRAYNLLLLQAASHQDLEALVLLHQDVEIVDPDFCSKVRDALRDPLVGVVGCVGALDARSLAWWEGSVTWASFTHRYYEHGGGELPAFAMHPDRFAPPPYARTGEVDTVDGLLMVLSPWAVRNLRFDESLGRFHGYDFDFCLQVRAAGRKVVTADLKAIHHHSLELVNDFDEWVRAHIRIAEKWEGRMPEVGSAPGSWKERALRAEAERDAFLLLSYARRLELEARTHELERAISLTTKSIYWRIPAPFR